MSKLSEFEKNNKFFIEQQIWSFPMTREGGAAHHWPTHWLPRSDHLEGNVDLVSGLTEQMKICQFWSLGIPPHKCISLKTVLLQGCSKGVANEAIALGAEI